MHIQHVAKSHRRRDLPFGGGCLYAGAIFVNLLLSKHEMTPGNHSQSMQLQKEELTDKTLILTMTFPEKVQFLETYGDGYAVYTLGEFAGVETDVSDPYGAEEEAYEKCFEEIEERIRLTIHRLEEEEKDDSIG